MTTLTLVILDVSGIQSYLFASNRMAHNVGASWLVEQAISDAPHGWVWDALCKSGARTGNDHVWQPDSASTAEVVYCGGGNVVLLFKDSDTARQFVRAHASLALERARGLRVLACHKQFDWEQQSFSEVYAQALQELASRKLDQQRPLPMPALGVTAACDYTGAPAVDALPDPDNRLRRVSAEVRDKQHAREQARDRWRKSFGSLLGENYEFVEDFNQMGEERSQFLAVVHADGNSIGRRKQAICAGYQKPEQNHELALALRQFSIHLNEAGQAAFENTLSHMIAWLESDRNLPPQERRFGRWDGRQLPFLPLVYGGDDVTFVCDGRLGLSLAAIYLRQFKQQSIKQQSSERKEPFNACAGVAIVKNRYPFAQAYRMAEALSKQAKQRVRQERQDGNASALDWHFAVSGAVRDLSDIRRVEYQVGSGSLCARPCLIGEPTQQAGEVIRDWDTFRSLTRAFNAPEWRERRNKVKALREWLRRGPDAVKTGLEAFEIKSLPDIQGLDEGVRNDVKHSGWYGETCAYFDAIEALDLFIDLEDQPHG